MKRNKASITHAPAPSYAGSFAHRWIVPTLLAGATLGACVDVEDSPELDLGEHASPIVGGTDVGPFEHRYVAYLEFGSPREFNPWCTGALIHRDWVITAAHCIRLHGEPYYIDIGLRELADSKPGQPEPGSGVERRYPAEVIVHPSYSWDPYHNFDVALIRLNAPVTSIAPVRVGAPGIYTDYTVRDPSAKLTAVGWGYTTPDGHFKPDILQKVDVSMRTHADMEAAWPGGYYSPTWKIGYGGFESGAPFGTCQGDSGGPLLGDSSVYTRRKSTHPIHNGPILIGVHYWTDCANGKPAIATRLDDGVILAWVINTIGGEKSDRLQCGPQIYGFSGYAWHVGYLSSVMCLPWEN